MSDTSAETGNEHLEMEHPELLDAQAKCDLAESMDILQASALEGKKARILFLTVNEEGVRAVADFAKYIGADDATDGRETIMISPELFAEKKEYIEAFLGKLIRKGVCISSDINANGIVIASRELAKDPNRLISVIATKDAIAAICGLREAAIKRKQ